MLSRLASYLMRGAASGVEEEEPAAAAVATTTTPTTTPAENGITAIPVEARLRQVEVDGDDWILIDRNVEAMAGLDESWYVTPPACFTQPGPVHVETSPLEDLLIEHPSMSVYRAAGPAPLSDKPKSKERPGKRRTAVSQAANKALAPVAAPATVPETTTTRLPLVPRTNNLQPTAMASAAVPAAPRTSAPAPVSKLPRPQEQPQQQQQKQLELPSKLKNRDSASNNNRQRHRRHQHHLNPYQSAAGTVVEPTPRRASIRDFRNARGDENVRIVQIRSSQKAKNDKKLIGLARLEKMRKREDPTVWCLSGSQMLEKRSTQSTKRNRLERGNKAREVSSGKGRRPRRQDRLRLNNSGANNNRKC